MARMLRQGKRRKILVVTAASMLGLCVLASVFLVAVWFWPDPRFHETMATGRKELFLCRLQYIFQYDSARDYRVAKMNQYLGMDLTNQEAEAFLKANGNSIAAYGVLSMFYGNGKYQAALKRHEDDPLACYILSRYPSRDRLYYARRYVELDPDNAFSHLNLAERCGLSQDFPAQLNAMRQAAKCTRYENPMAQMIRAYVDHAECFDSVVKMRETSVFALAIYSSVISRMRIDSATSRELSPDELVELATLQLKSLDQMLHDRLMLHYNHRIFDSELLRWNCYKKAKKYLGSDTAILQFKPESDYSALNSRMLQELHQGREMWRNATPEEVDRIIRERLESLRKVVTE